MPALASANFSEMVEKAEQWRARNPLVSPELLMRPRRIFDDGAKAAYTVATMQHQVASAGAQPCSVCGQWTFSFCETCSMNLESLPPWAVCKPCDDDGMTCPTCKSEHRSWEAEKLRHSETDKGNVMEVSGVTLSDGTFKRFC